MRNLGLSVLASALLYAAPAFAGQEALVAAGSASEGVVARDTAQCELHVWPIDKLHSTFHGWTHGGTVDGSAKQRAGYPVMPADPFPIAAQAEALESLPLPALMGVADHRLVVHREALDRRARRALAGRHNVSAPACYAELIVDDMFVEGDIVTGSELKVLFRFRDFGTADTPQRSFSSWGRTDLKLFPPKDAANLDAALAELGTAYRADVRDFASTMAKPRKDKKAK